MYSYSVYIDNKIMCVYIYKPQIHTYIYAYTHAFILLYIHMYMLHVCIHTYVWLTYIYVMYIYLFIVASKEDLRVFLNMLISMHRYVAPEYAMTGHLLVKSDVYSYGVVLLELLSGRKPVDMSQPQGQENLVTWARPLLTSEEGIDALVDPALNNKYPPSNFVRVAAIASMCVQPEVSHRPFMGEVVQALKLVYNDSSNVANGDIVSSNCSLGGGGDSFDLSETQVGGGGYGGSGHELWAVDRNSSYVLDSFISIDYDSGPSHGATNTDVRRPHVSSSYGHGARHKVENDTTAGWGEGSIRRHSLSGPPSPRTWRGLKCSKQDGGSSEYIACSRFCVTE